MPCLYGSGNVALRTYVLRTDDFDYIARSRSATAFRQHVFTPLNEHVVPLFRIETHVLTVIAGSLEAVPEVFAWASYATLVLAVLLTGHVVARETGRPARGLIAMAAVGFSSVLGPSLLYYAASQALAAGIMILVMLAFFQSWRVRGSWWLLASGLVAAMAAPLFWTAGYSAGPVGEAYLMADGRRWCQRAARAAGCLTGRVRGDVVDHDPTRDPPIAIHRCHVPNRVLRRAHGPSRY